MNSNQFINDTNKDVAVASSIELHRNLIKYPFPNKMSVNQIEKVSEEIINAFFDCQNINKENWSIINLNNATKQDIQGYINKNLISNSLINNNLNKTLLLSKDENISILLCDEDHIKIKVILEGNNIDVAYKCITEIDNVFCSKFKIAFSSRLGFLTENISNIGTAMKPTIILHLPSLKKSGELSKTMESVSKIGFSLSQTSNDYDYILTNNITMGITELEAIRNLGAISTQIITKERYFREVLFDNTL